MTDKFPLALEAGHLFLEVEGERWLIDTGSPTSFGHAGELRLDGLDFSLVNGLMGLDAESLSNFTGSKCTGLLGADVLGRFDWIFDLVAGEATLTTGEAALEGTRVSLGSYSGIPLLTASAGGRALRLFFDTGAQITFLGPEVLPAASPEEEIPDFYPGIGRFQVGVHKMDVGVGDLSENSRCGKIPGPLAGLLAAAGADGIMGNEILKGRVTGYFPRRSALLFGKRDPESRA